jgi:hypothetical protein
VTNRDPSEATRDPRRPAPRRRGASRDSAKVTDNEATTPWPDGIESSYPAAASPTDRSTARRDSDDAPFEVHIEFVRLDGPEGRALRRRQAQIMRKVLQWLADHPDPDNQ